MRDFFGERQGSNGKSIGPCSRRDAYGPTQNLSWLRLVTPVEQPGLSGSEAKHTWESGQGRSKGTRFRAAVCAAWKPQRNRRWAGHSSQGMRSLGERAAAASQLSVPGPSRRQAVRPRHRQGVQRILITSPCVWVAAAVARNQPSPISQPAACKGPFCFVARRSRVRQTQPNRFPTDPNGSGLVNKATPPPPPPPSRWTAATVDGWPGPRGGHG